MDSGKEPRLPLRGTIVKEALTFDDVLLVPGHSLVHPRDTDISTRLTNRIALQIPLVSAAMDTVTEARMAIAVAREGGVGVIHKNMSVERQAQEVDRVKRSESGMILNPITLGPEASLRDAHRLMARFAISGVPIVQPDGILVGIITNRDLQFETDLNRPVSALMTSKGLITTPVGTTLEEAQEILHRYRIEKLPLVDADGYLKGLITYKDILKRQDFPHSAKDDRGRLLVAGAIGVGAPGLQRAESLVNAGADALAVDTAHGHTQGVIDTVRAVRARYPELPILAGNVVTAEGVQVLTEAGADVVKVGVGAGSICTTRIVSGAGMPQLTAISTCAEAAQSCGVSLIADGGIRYSGDITKALACGASAVMLGGLLAGLHESPGEIVIREGRSFKEYRGMGSIGAMKGRAADRYASAQSLNGASPDIGGKTVPEGIEGQVPYKGFLNEFVFQLLGGLRSGMGYVGAQNLPDLWRKARFVRISPAGYQESHPHSVVITKEAPNYQVNPGN